MSDDKVTLKERLHNIARNWGFEPRPPTVETVLGSLPTASGNDDGAGWNYVWDEASHSYVYQREVIIGLPPENVRHLYNEGSPGVWHKKS